MQTLGVDLIVSLFSHRFGLTFGDALACVCVCSEWRIKLERCGQLWASFSRLYGLDGRTEIKESSGEFAMWIRERTVLDASRFAPPLTRLREKRPKKYPRSCLLVLGGKFSGKTCLICRVVHPERFVEYYDPTIADVYRRLLGCSCHAEACPILLEIIEAYSSEEFSALTDQWIRDSQVFWTTILPHSITNGEAETILNDLKSRIVAVKEEEAALERVIIVMTKCDEATPEQLRRFEALCMKLKLRFICVSAKENINMDQLISATAHIAWNAGPRESTPTAPHRSRCIAF